MSDWSSAVCASVLAAFPALSDDDWGAVLRTNPDGFYNILKPLSMAIVSARRGGHADRGERFWKIDLLALHAHVGDATIWSLARCRAWFRVRQQSSAPERCGAGVTAARCRSEERRVGKECVSKCSSRWSPDH